MNQSTIDGVRNQIRRLIIRLNYLDDELKLESSACPPIAKTPAVAPVQQTELPPAAIISTNPTLDEYVRLHPSTPSEPPLKFKGQDELLAKIEEGRLKRLARESTEKQSNMIGSICFLEAIQKPYPLA